MTAIFFATLQGLVEAVKFVCSRVYERLIQIHVDFDEQIVELVAVKVVTECKIMRRVQIKTDGLADLVELRVLNVWYFSGLERGFESGRPNRLGEIASAERVERVQLQIVDLLWLQTAYFDELEFVLGLGVVVRCRFGERGEIHGLVDCDDECAVFATVRC